MAKHRRRRRTGLRTLTQQALAWLLVTVFVAAVAGATVGISSALGAPSRPPTVALLLAAAVVTLALPRVRRAADRLANRLVLGDRADAYELVSDFVRSAASTLPIDEVLPRLAETAARSVRSPRGEALVWLADGGQWREAWPMHRAEGAAAVNVDVRHEGRAIGELGVTVNEEGVDAAAARHRLRALAAPAGLALSTVRLTMDLRRRLDELARTDAELRASQRRLIEARLEERQRFVRAIDSFIRPHLAVAVQALAQAGAVATDQVETELASAARHTEVALERLRSLTHGVFPVELLHAGLAEALTTWADESEVALTVHRLDDPDLARRSPTAAAVQYFACVEALQGLRPRPSAANVELSETDGMATMAVNWSAGGPVQLDGDTALRLRDRAEAVGGTVKVSPGGLLVRVPADVLG